MFLRLVGWTMAVCSLPAFGQTYIKPTVAQAGYFGYSTAMSGNTLVVGAVLESSGSTGVNGNPNDNSAPASGAAYVYVWDGLSWTLQAYLKPAVTHAGMHFGSAVAISGNTIVVGADFESSNATGVNGDQTNTSLNKSGAAYVFVRSGTQWSQQAYLKASVARLSANGLTGFLFGVSVGIDADTIVVGANQENGSATGVNGDPNPSTGTYAGAAYVFTRTGGVWSQQAYLKSYSPTKDLFFGQAVAVGGDLVAVGGEDQTSAVGINPPVGVTGGIYNQGEATVFSRTGTVWTRDAFIKTPVLHAGSQFGSSLALQSSRLVVGAPYESSDAAGVDVGVFGPYRQAGAAYTFTRSAGVWTQESYVKPAFVAPGAVFGYSVALDTSNLLVGSLFESSASSGINGNPADTSLGQSGAAYQFTLSGSTWTQQQYIKAPHPQASAYFGMSVAGQNGIIAVGSYNEGSNATGIGGNDTDTSLPGAGAVFAYAGPATQSVTIQSAPTGISFNTAGVGCSPGTYTTPQTLSWKVGAVCTVTMPTTVPGSGQQNLFVQWEDGSVNQGRSITAPAAPATYTATYKMQYQLAVNSNPPNGGTVSGAGINAYFDPGTAVTLTPQPAVNYVFASWGGACSGVGPGQCALTINAPTAVAANFQATQLPLTVSVPAGVQYSVGAQTYSGTQTITLPPGGYTLAVSSPQSTGVGTQLTFSYWSDGGAASHTVNLVNTPVSVTGNFVTQYLLTTAVSPAGAGLVTGAGYYNTGTQVQVFEGPNPGYTFNVWTGACSGSVSCVVTMNGPASVTANFNANKYNLTINVPAGIAYNVSGFSFTGPQTFQVPAGVYTLSLVSPQAVATGTQSVFLSWSDGGAQSHNINFSGPLTITGAFKTQYMLTTAVTPAGQGLVSGGPWVDAGTNAFVSAVGNPGYEFEYWSGGFCKGSVAVCVIPMSAPASVTGHFSVPLGNYSFPFDPASTPAPTRTASAMAYDAGRHEVVMFGGVSNGASLNDTWRFTGTGWIQVLPLGFVPAGRNIHAMAYHAGTGKMVMAGGSLGIDNLGNPINESMTHTFECSTEYWDAPFALPSPRMGTHLVEYGSNVPMFGGIYGTGLTNGIVTQGDVLTDTYVFNGTIWIPLNPAHHPPGRFGGAIAFDSVRNQVVLVGGYAPGAGGLQQLNDTWIFDGNDWYQANPATNIPALPAAMTFDPSIQQVVAFIAYDHVWTWDGATWIQRETNISFVANAVYDSFRQQVFASNPTYTGLYRDWVRIPPKVSLVPGGVVTVSIDAVTGKYQVNFALKQQGNVPIQAYPITATVGGVAASVVDQSPEMIAPSVNGDWTALFPRSVGPGFKVLTVTGFYVAPSTTVSGNWSISVLVNFP